MYSRQWQQWAPYVPVADRRRNAAAEMAKLANKGHQVSPVRIAGREIASTARTGPIAYWELRAREQ